MLTTKAIPKAIITNNNSITLTGLKKSETNLWDPSKNQSLKYRTSYMYTLGSFTPYSGLYDSHGNFIGNEISYIASYEPKGVWTPEKQIAMWFSSLGNVSPENGQAEGHSNIDISGYGNEVIVKGEEIYSEALEYNNFVTNYGGNDGNNYKVIDRTTYSNVQTERVVENGTEYYVLGPFKMEYKTNTYYVHYCGSHNFWAPGEGSSCSGFGNVSFGGITNISIKLTNSDGTTTTKTVESYGYSSSNANVQFKYYTPKASSATYGDGYVQNSLHYNSTTGKYSKPTQIDPQYPSSNQDFYLKIKAEGITGVTNARLKVEYKYMQTDMDKGITHLIGEGRAVEPPDPRDIIWIDDETYNVTVDIINQLIYYDENSNPIYTFHIQDLIIADGDRFLKDGHCGGNFQIVPPVMNIEGYVWNDIESGKECLANGVYDTATGSTDKPLANIKVTLYYSDGTKVPESDFEPVGETALRYKINPTLTKDDGYYMFAGLDSTKRYYVEFEYEGQKYIPTDYIVNLSGRKSKAVELGNIRTTLDNRFKEIKSSPKSYTASVDCGFDITDNITFTRLELMGYTLTYNETEQKYQYIQDPSKQLIDGYLYNTLGQTTTEYREGIITTKIKEYIVAHSKYPSNSALKTIYANIAGNNTRLKQEIQFIEDCKIKATTASKSGSSFVRKTYSINDAEYDSSESILKISNVNLGLCNRQVFDLNLWNDASVMTVQVNNKTENYNFDTVFTQYTTNYGNIRKRLTAELSGTKKYNEVFSRPLYKSDYNVYEYDDDHSRGEVEVFIKYRIELHNESPSVVGKVTEVVDNFVDTLEFVSIDANIDGQNIDVSATTTTTYPGTEENLTGYNKLYIHGLENTAIASGRSIVINMVFKVKSEDGYVDTNITKNIAEINGFKTFYKINTELPNDVVINNTNTTPGLIDWDSLPGNLVNSHLQGDHYEVNIQDDTDISHAINEPLRNEERTISGTVWEDKRNKVVGDSITGNGLKENDETRIKGVTVTLKERVGSKYVTANLYNKATDEWFPAVTKTDENGMYTFKGFIPGDYIVQFDYGDKINTVLTNDVNNETNKILKDGAPSTVNNVIGDNVNSYNGQDYKSTLFQAGVSAGYDILNMKYDYNTLDTLSVSDALDLFGETDLLDDEQGRNAVNEYSKVQTNHIAEVLVSPYSAPKYPLLENGKEVYDGSNNLVFETYGRDEMNALINELIENTRMTAITPKIIAEVEYNAQETPGNFNGVYKLSNLDFGLVERPKAQLEIDKTVEHVTVTLSDGTILFDNSQGAKNLVWHKQNEWNVRDQQNLLVATNINSYDDQYKYRNAVMNNLRDLSNSTGGIISVIIDNELMYGATINITYDVKVTNVGEVDYNSYQYYAKGIVPESAPKSTTSSDIVVCYVPNNMQFYKKDNVDSNGEYIWETVNGDNIVESGLVNSNLEYLVDTYNTIIGTENLKVNLENGESTNIKLILSQLISKSNDDDLSYESLVEIVKTTNTLGRRMSYSVVGNQNPHEDPAEVDASKGETVQVMPPFGIKDVLYLTLAVAVAAILVVGIMLIKKNVIKK